MYLPGNVLFLRSIDRTPISSVPRCLPSDISAYHTLAFLATTCRNSPRDDDVRLSCGCEFPRNSIGRTLSELALRGPQACLAHQLLGTMGCTVQADERGRRRTCEEVPRSAGSAGAFCPSRASIPHPRSDLPGHSPRIGLSPLSRQVEAETQSDIAESFEVEAVPTFVILRVRHAILRPSVERY